jgi:ATP-dependent DNA ligase
VLSWPVDPVRAVAARSMPDPRSGSVYEMKWDGFRAVVWRTADGARIQSRQGVDLTRFFPNPQELRPMGEARRSAGPPHRIAELRDVSPDLVTDGRSCI